MQRFFTQEGDVAAARCRCAACGADTADTAEHLLEECPKALLIFEPYFGRLSGICALPAAGCLWTSLVLGYAPSPQAAVQCVAAVGRIAKLVQSKADRLTVTDSDSESSAEDPILA